MIPTIRRPASLSLSELARTINAQHDRYEAARTRLEFAIEAGESLIEAKALIGHGGWSSLVSENLTVSLRMVQRYMQLARNRATLERMARPGSITHLPIRDAVRLLAKKQADDGGDRLVLPAVGWRMTGVCGSSVVIAEREPDGEHAFAAVVRGRLMYRTKRGTSADHIRPVLQVLLREAGEAGCLSEIAWKFSQCEPATTTPARATEHLEAESCH